jgi:FixJ family two-component response regulator
MKPGSYVPQIVSIVDDDPSVRAAMEDLVAALGFSAHGFECAEDFLSSSDVSEAACVISDVQMAGMKGYELQQELLAQGYRKPMIFVTAFPDGTIRRRIEAAGAFAFLEKPFDGDRLVSCLLQALGQGSPQ